MPLALPDIVTSTLEEGRQAYIAVPSKHGPHVTPELYAWSGGNLWFAVASSTLKAKVLAKDPAAGVSVSIRDRSVVLRGRVDVLDPRQVGALAKEVRGLPEAARALARYTVRNAPDLLAFAGDTVAGKLGRRLPPMRLLLRFEPTHAALIEADAVVDAWGGWSSPAESDSTDLPAGGQPAVVGLPGPVALPARWFDDDQLLRFAPGALELLDLEPSFPLGVVVDEYTAPGPAAKQGTLLRGKGRLGDQPATIEVEGDRLVAWDGVETSSTDA
jgi:hypothetical protein